MARGWCVRSVAHTPHTNTSAHQNFTSKTPASTRTKCCCHCTTSQDGVSGVSNRDRHGTGGWRYYQQASSMPTWQVLLLLAAALGALYLVLSHTNPRARAAQVVVGHSNTLKCFPLKDEEAARLLGADKAYSRAIVTASARSQTLFDLGMLAAHGFNQLEAAAWFQVCG